MIDENLLIGKLSSLYLEAVIKKNSHRYQDSEFFYNGYMEAIREIQDFVEELAK